jgi:predicted dehydrogenase
MTVRTAVIGVGMMGRNHARVYADMPGVELVGVADASLEAATQVVNRYSGTAYADYLQLLEEQQPDAVTIAVPTEDHLEVALQVIQRGIHLLIEKPIAYSVEQAQQIITAAQQANVVLMIGHIERFNPAVVELKRRLTQGELGRVFQIDARRQSPFPARVRDVGVVIDLAVHDVDVMRYITGAEVTRVFAETERRIHSTQEDLMTGLLRLHDGTVGTLTINWLTPTKIRELYVTGERGMFRVDYLLQDLYYFENATTSGSEWETIRTLRGVSEGQMTRYVVAKKEPLRAELEHFIAAVRGEQDVMVTGLDGLKALALARALVTAGVNHHVVEMDI